MNFLAYANVIFAFFVLFYLPGISLLRHLGVWQSLNPGMKTFLPIGPSLLLSPALLFLLGHFFPIGNPWNTLCIFFLFIPFFFFSFKGEVSFEVGPISKNQTRLIFLFMTWVFLVALIILYQNDASRIFPVVGDFPKHFGVAWALSGETIPVSNPFFHPGEPYRLSYYFLYHLIPASFLKTTSFAPGNLFALTNALVGVGTLGCIFLWIRCFHFSLKAFLFGAGFLIFFGPMDVPIIYLQGYEEFQKCTESFWSCWWSIFPIYSTAWLGVPQKIGHFLGYITWVPQHLLSVSGLFLLPVLFKAKSRTRSKLFFFFIPLIHLSVWGSSIYVAMAGSILGVFYLLSRIRNKVFLWRKIFSWESILLFLVSVLLLLILAFEIMPRSSTSTAGFSFFPFHSSLFFGETNSLLLKALDSSLYLLWGFLPIFVGLILLKRDVFFFRGEDAWLLTLFFGGVFLACLIGSRGQYNDFGKHSLFISWISGCILLGKAFSTSTLFQKRDWVMIPYSLILIVSFLTPAYSILGLGFHRIHALSTSTNQKNIDFMNACRFLRENSPPDSVVQGPIRKMSYLQFFSQRQTVVLDHFHGALLNVEPKAYDNAAQVIANIFGNLEDPRAVIASRMLGIDFLVVPKHSSPKNVSKGFQLAFENKSYLVLRVEANPKTDERGALEDTDLGSRRND